VGEQPLPQVPSEHRTGDPASVSNIAAAIRPRLAPKWIRRRKNELEAWYVSGRQDHCFFYILVRSDVHREVKLRKIAGNYYGQARPAAHSRQA